MHVSTMSSEQLRVNEMFQKPLAAVKCIENFILSKQQTGGISQHYLNAVPYGEQQHWSAGNREATTRKAASANKVHLRGTLSNQYQQDTATCLSSLETDLRFCWKSDVLHQAALCH